MIGWASRATQGSLVTENQSCSPASISHVLSSCSSPAWILLGSPVAWATILWHKWHFAKITRFLDRRRQRPQPSHGQGRKIVCSTLTAKKLEEGGWMHADTSNECWNIYFLFTVFLCPNWSIREKYLRSVLQFSTLFMQIDRNCIQSTALHQFTVIKKSSLKCLIWTLHWPSCEFEHCWKFRQWILHIRLSRLMDIEKNFLLFISDKMEITLDDWIKNCTFMG